MRKEFESARATIDTYRGKARFCDLRGLKEHGYEVDALPYSIRVLLENTLRHASHVSNAGEAAHRLAAWPRSVGSELPFMPFRVLLQDYTGVPLIVDLAAMRSAAARKGLSPGVVNSRVPVDLVIDHSIQVDSWASQNAILLNLDREYERNAERYSLLKWAQSSFDGIRIFPPGKGICHQVNLEYLASVAALREVDGELTAFPDTLVGTDSHTTMVNGLGVLGWGVGGIEAEAVMLGEPYYMQIPKVVGVKLTGRLQEGATPTDLVLTVTEALRKEDVVGAFVEYFGDAYRELSVPDRATLGNMSPEYGATVGFSPVDDSTIAYLTATGRDPAHAEFVKKYCTLAGLFLQPNAPEPNHSKVIEIDLAKIEPSIAGPRNPDERVPLKSAASVVANLLEQHRKKSKPAPTGSASFANDGYQLDSHPQQYAVLEKQEGGDGGLNDGAVVIAAITSCTNTSNPTVMVGAGLLADKAVKLGLRAKPYVKTSMAPGSAVVRDYLADSGLLPPLEALGFSIVGYGCTTCIGNSGPLSPEVEREIRERDLYSVAVLSGNRNFDGRIHPLVKASFLMSPMLVVAYALTGRIDFDFYKEPLGSAPDGSKVFLKDIWPVMGEIQQVIGKSLSPELYKKRYADALEGDNKWRNLTAPGGEVYGWSENSTYIREPPWFMNGDNKTQTEDVKDARVLAIFEDKVTTDHISPAGSIQPDSPAGLYLQRQGVVKAQFSSYGSRRGNHEVMLRGGFSNIRLKNILAKGKEGGWTTHYPSGELMTVYDAAVRYQAEGVPLIILAGKQYGAGSSRDWAAKATKLLGVRAVIAESFERIHRSNLVAMGVLPLELADGWRKLELKGDETYDIIGIREMKEPGARLTVKVRSKSEDTGFEVVAKLENDVEIEYYRKGGVLPYVFRKLTGS